MEPGAQPHTVVGISIGMNDLAGLNICDEKPKSSDEQKQRSLKEKRRIAKRLLTRLPRRLEQIGEEA